MNKPLIHIHQLSFAWDREMVLEDIDLKIFENDFIGMIGPNGGGKTTLIKMMLGLLSPQKGKIYFREGLRSGKRPIGYLPQMKNLDRSFPITVMDVIRSGSLMRNQPFRDREEERDKALALMAEMGISSIEKKAIGQLSGGEMQRVFICRALISDTKLLILDEPGTYVDHRFGKEIFDKLRELNRRMAVLLVSHDTGMVREYAKSVVYLDRTLSTHPLPSY